MQFSLQSVNLQLLSWKVVLLHILIPVVHKHYIIRYKQLLLTIRSRICFQSFVLTPKQGEISVHRFMTSQYDNLKFIKTIITITKLLYINIIMISEPFYNI